MTEYKAVVTSWQAHEQAMAEIRETVFIREQQVPEELEWDEHDPHCTHVLVFEKQLDREIPVATARLLADGHIGRMAVLPAHRHRGIGSLMLQTLMEHARTLGLSEVFLHAQTSAIPFYGKHDFHICSDEFMDAGIPHRTMKKKL